MKYGILLPLSGIDGSLERLVEYAHIAEEEGWDGVFLEDYSVYGVRGGVTYDPWLALTAIALRTKRVRLGIMVTPLPSRLPWQVAREAITLDHLSHGRVILGVGLGDPQDRHFGEIEEVKQRAQMLDEGLEILVGLMSGQPFRYEGQQYQVQEVTFGQRPVQRPRIPIWVGGLWSRKAPARRAARWDGFCPAKAPDEHGYSAFEPAEIRAINVFLAQERRGSEPFDLVVGGSSPGEDAARARAQVEAVGKAGATWWTEFVLPGPGEGEHALRWIKQGVPR
jgi:alkanesulfonate monooxygenase SsuD/methylene tetrahydromethanopterin reductase-like flavin-dependent oxidoreductase (luciferase family)